MPDQPGVAPVLLTGDVARADELGETVRAAAAAAGPAADLGGAASLATRLGRELGGPGCGETRHLWESLASLGATDLTVARVVEPHLDALAILRQAHEQGEVDPAAWDRLAPAWLGAPLWGVYAAEGPGRVEVTRGADGDRLSGTKSWCSLAERASHALVTARLGEDRGLWALDLRQAGVHPEGADGWVARGLAALTSTALRLDDVPAVAIGAPGWYLSRPGFAWGGVGVAAVWFGGTVGVARRLHRAAHERTPDQVARVHLGAVDRALAAARDALAHAAARADDPSCTREEADLVAQRVRATVAEVAEDVLSRVARALGPGPLTGEEEHARRVADLQVYLRQHHAERDLDRLGATVLDAPTAGWSWW